MYDFSKLQDYLDSLIQGGVPGCSAAVYMHGKPVFSHCAGYADREKTRPVSEDDIYYIYSCTKPITVAAAMQLVEQGKLGLDDPVCRYLPEYADAYYMEDGNRCSNLGEFGWDGAAGAHVLMDPAAQVAIVYMQHAHDCHHPPYARLQELCYEALEL